MDPKRGMRQSAKKQNQAKVMINLNPVLALATLILGAKGLSELLRRLSRGDLAHLAVLRGDGNQQMAGPDFRGGFASAIFGNATLDLQAVQPETKPITLVLFSLAGNVIVKVPITWKIKTRSILILANSIDQRPEQPKLPDEPVVMEIYGLGLFGNLLVRS